MQDTFHQSRQNIGIAKVINFVPFDNSRWKEQVLKTLFVLNRGKLYTFLLVTQIKLKSYWWFWFSRILKNKKVFYTIVEVPRTVNLIFDKYCLHCTPFYYCYCYIWLQWTGFNKSKRLGQYHSTGGVEKNSLVIVTKAGLSNIYYNYYHSHKTRKDSLETGAILPIFCVNLKFLGWPCKEYIKTAKY